MAKNRKIRLNSSGYTGWIPPLPSPYHNARKQYGLVSALLIAWAFVPLSIKSNAPLTIFESIEIKDINLLPLILVILMVYSGIRVTIEWMQADKKRREQEPSKYDFWISHAIAVTAVMIFIVKELSTLSIVNKKSDSPWNITLLFLIGGLIPFLCYRILKKLFNGKPKNTKNVLTVCLMFSLLLLILVILMNYISSTKGISLLSIIAFFIPQWFGILLMLYRKLVLGKIWME